MMADHLCQTAIQQRVRVGRLAMLGGMGSSTKTFRRLSCSTAKTA